MLLRVTCAVLIVMAMGCLSVQSEPDPMARPTRPKVFTTPEELRQYLDLVRDYYTLNAKPRYGKRADTYPAALEQPINILRMIMAIDRQKQRKQDQHQQLQNDNKLQMMYPPYERPDRYDEIME